MVFKKPKISLPVSLSQIQGYIGIFLFLVGIVGYFINESNKAAAKKVADALLIQQVNTLTEQQAEFIKALKDNNNLWFEQNKLNGTYNISLSILLRGVK